MQPINFDPTPSINPISERPFPLRVIDIFTPPNAPEEFDPNSHANQTRYQANIGQAKLLMGLGGNKEAVEQLKNAASTAAIIADPDLIITNANQVASQLESQGQDNLATRIRNSVQS